MQKLLGPTTFALQGLALTKALEGFRSVALSHSTSGSLQDRVRQAIPAELTGLALTKGLLEAARASLAVQGQATVEQQLRGIQISYQSLLGPISATAQLRAMTEQLRPYDSLSEAMRTLSDVSSSLSARATAVYEEMAKSPSLMTQLPSWLVQAPAIVPYSAAIVVAIEAGSPTAAIARHSDVTADGILRSVGDELEQRLLVVGAEFVELYRGAFAALQLQGPDWRRHVCTSVRELVDHLIRRLAPDADLDNHYSQPDVHKENGVYTRRARLTFIFREIAIHSYVQMAEKDIDMTLATFFPTNATVHSLVAPLSAQQVMVFWRRVQGCVSTVLQAAGH
jgi:hypothetical protein